jgi:hypothetical protein
MKTVIAILFVGVVLLPASASAGIDVDPSKLRPELFIRTERSSPQRAVPADHAPRPAKNAPAGRRPTEAAPVVCSPSPGLGGFDCAPEGAPDAVPVGDDDEPELTEGDILQAVRRIGLPSLQVRIQPGDETLVNIPTIFYTRPEPFERSVDLLGFDIDLTAEPIRYRWVHGDGTARTTAQPGRPYPAMDVTHRYRRPADDLDARVDVTYQVRYRVDDGAWQTVGQTLVAAGPTAGLEVREAAPVLARP